MVTQVLCNGSGMRVDIKSVLLNYGDDAKFGDTRCPVCAGMIGVNSDLTIQRHGKDD
jgi:hypothetical protein